LLYVGGISPHKNLSTLVTAFAALPRPDLRLVLVGDYAGDAFLSDYETLRGRIAALGVIDRVIFTGYVLDADLVHLYNAALALVLPSFDEGFGLPVLEAMACGSPVIASRAGALPEVVGDAGQLFNPHAPGELAQAVQALLSNPALAADCRSRGLARAASYSWARSAEAALAAFEAALSTRPHYAA
jgi:glycosyltransferase involved in cell wall biosynthesis